MITVECPKCKMAMEVPDTAAGARGKCRKCGGIVQVPSGVQKICIGCGADVSAAKRVKDDAGQYRCTNCYQQIASQAKTAEIESLSTQLFEIKRARRIGNVVALCVGTPVLASAII